MSVLLVATVLISLLSVTASAAGTENCPGDCSHVAAVGKTHYDTFQEAIDAVPEGGTVELLRECEKQVTLNDKKSFGIKNFSYFDGENGGEGEIKCSFKVYRINTYEDEETGLEVIELLVKEPSFFERLFSGERFSLLEYFRALFQRLYDFFTVR